MKSIKLYTEWVNHLNEQSTEGGELLQSIKDFVISDDSLSDPKFLSSISSNLSPLSPEAVSNLVNQVSKIKEFSKKYSEGADFLVGADTFKGCQGVTPQQIKSIFPNDKSQFVRFVIEDSGYLQSEGNIEPVVAITANRAQEDPIKGTFKEFEKGKVKWLFTFGPRFTSVFKVMTGQSPQFVLKADNQQLFSIPKGESGEYGLLGDISKNAQNYLTLFPKKAKETAPTEEGKPRVNYAPAKLKRG